METKVKNLRRKNRAYKTTGEFVIKGMKWAKSRFITDI